MLRKRQITSYKRQIIRYEVQYCHWVNSSKIDGACHSPLEIRDSFKCLIIPKQLFNLLW